ncbi:MAG TPA: tetratricopeptide repeat protein [Thermoanaerobaculia bacterium]|nr:tetratricopeptide repeat protein [Thermoanaerobaculia bacterium]
MSTYPGNVSLSNAVKERVVSTFQQALALYKQGRSDEVVQGCGLILRMDPQFDPAKKLMEKARNPNAPVDIDALSSQLSADPMSEARAAMTARNFQKVIDLTTEVLTNDLTNDEARQMNEQAREKLEASPFVDQFVKKAEQAIASGNVAAARAGIDKIKSLDPDDTALARLETALNQAQAKQQSAPSASFVVDTPAPQAGRGTAQASDFGFTFEEEKGGAQQQQGGGFANFSFDSPFSTDTGTTPAITPPPGFQEAVKPPAAEPGSFSFDTPPPSSSFAGGFSFDTPTPAAAPTQSGGGGGPHEFDFTTASVETSPDDQKKIQQYLADGDKAFDAGDYQGAIDLWSRIFLIDVTNDQASERVEKAKKKKRETEQRSENLLSAAVAAFESGDRATAKEKFNQVLKLDPTNAQAQDYLGRMVELPTEGGAAGFETPFSMPETAKSGVFDEDLDLPSTPPPSPASAAPAAFPAAAPKKAAAKPKAAPAPSRSLTPVILIVVAVAIVVGGGWFAWTKFMSKPSYDPAATDAIFKTTNSLAQKGQYDGAIAMLHEVKSNDPQHDKALQLMADLQQKKSTTSTQTSAASLATYQQSIDAGRTAFNTHDYDAAKKSFDAAVRIKPLPADVQPMYDTASQQVAKLDGAKALFAEQRYADALTNLQSLQQQDPQNASIKRLIADAHFNLGAADLQSEKLDDAEKEFDEVLKIDPSDELAKRSKALAERYNGQPKDLLYHIYVKYLPIRKVT